MIGSLRGQLVDRDQSLDKPSADVILDVGGVGYRLTVTGETLGRLPSSGEVMLHVYHHFSDPGQRLFGFLTKDERLAFEGLLAAHKVGPSLAIAIIATHPPKELARILDDDDVDSLCQVPGVGPKTAKRLLIELRSKLVLPEASSSSSGNSTASTSASGPPTRGSVLADVRGALVELGYSNEEARAAVAELPRPDQPEDHSEPEVVPDSGDLLRQALRILGGP